MIYSPDVAALNPGLPALIPSGFAMITISIMDDVDASSYRVWVKSLVKLGSSSFGCPCLLLSDLLEVQHRL
jgi:hypothetical protein